MDIWRFPRTALAAQYVRNLTTLGAKRMTFFARRRTGKTTFLLNDLAPEAEDDGFIVTYVSLWEQKDAPHIALREAFEQTIRRVQNDKSILRRFFSAKVAKLKFDGDLLGAGKLGADIEFAEHARKASSDDLQELVASFKALIEVLNGVPFLLMLDEIQHLATNPKFEPLTFSLRTLLDIAPDNIKVVFTGSSRSGLDALFKDSKAPFFNFSDNITFPLMGEDFVCHLEKVYSRVTGKNLPHDRLMQIFDQNQCNAYYIHALVKGMALNAIDDIEVGYAHLEALIAEDGGFEKIWGKMSAQERYCFLALANGHPIFSDAALAGLRSRTGKWDRGTLQRAINKLLDKNLILKEGHGQYSVENEPLLNWAKKLPAEKQS